MQLGSVRMRVRNSTHFAADGLLAQKKNDRLGTWSCSLASIRFCCPAALLH